jgi:transposase
VDRIVLEELLGDGLSLAEIGRRCGRHESTVAYWVAKYGLEAANRRKYARRPAPSPTLLESLVDVGLSTTQIAERIGVSRTTVRQWLREYGLSTQWAERRQALAAGQDSAVLRCRRHGLSTFKRRAKGGYLCTKCRSEAVTRRRRKIKRILVAEAGGRCAVCGYDRCVSALEFHHRDPSEKRFTLSQRGVTRSLEKAREEARKCVLLCGNCHAEVEAGLVAVAQFEAAP